MSSIRFLQSFARQSLPLEEAAQRMFVPPQRTNESFSNLDQ
jgi:hypothetical protein